MAFAILQSSLPSGFTSELFLQIGIVLLGISATVIVTLWIASMTDSLVTGLTLGTAFFALQYFGITLLQLPILAASPVAIMLTLIAVGLASITANIEVSRADL